jgi:competence protein ComEC
MVTPADRESAAVTEHLWFAAFICVALAAIIAYFRAWWYVLPIILILLLLSFLKPSRHYPLGWVALLLAAIIFYYPTMEPPAKTLPEIKNTSVVGTVASIPRVDEERTRFVLTTDQGNRYHRQYQVVCQFSLPIKKGDKLWLTGSLEPPHQGGNPGEFDYRKYLYHQGVYYLLSVKKADDITKIEPAGGWQGMINSYRDRMLQGTKEYMTSQESAVLRGMLLGDIDDIDPQLYDEFQNTGIVHLFSVSGLHIGFLLLLSSWLTSLLGARRSYRLIAGIVLLLVYGTLISWPIPVIRASIMGGMGLLAYYSGRPQQMLNSLGIAGLLIIVVDPHALFTISFQLSFLATWGLIYLFPLLRQRIPYSGLAVDALLVPFCAQVAITPAIAYYFNLISPVSILANLLVTYLSGLVVMLGFVALVFVMLAPLAGICLFAAGLLIEMILLATHFCNALPGGVLWVATPGVLAIGTYYAGLFLLVSWPVAHPYYRSAGRLGIVLILIFLTAVFWPPSWRDRGTMEAVFLDVGQGDALLIKSPQGRFIMVDGGGSQFYKVGEMKVIPYLRHRGINKLDLVINTHPDSDHLLGLTEVMEEIKVERFAYPQALRDAPDYSSIFRLALQKSIPLWGLQAGQVLQVEPGFSLEVLHPSLEPTEIMDTNHLSLVLRCRYHRNSILLTGDLDKQAMQEMAGNAIKCDLLKVPHHGSRTSLLEEFYENCDPRAAVISVGNNQFGHPHPEVVDELHGQGIKIYRTDHHGAIRCTSDGNDLKIETYINEGNSYQP